MGVGMHDHDRRGAPLAGKLRGGKPMGSSSPPRQTLRAVRIAVRLAIDPPEVTSPPKLAR